MMRFLVLLFFALVLVGCASPKVTGRLDSQAAAVSLASPQAQSGGTAETNTGMVNKINVPMQPVAGGDQKGIEVKSEGGIGMLWIAIAGFVTIGWVVSAGFASIVRIVRRYR